MKVRVTSEFKVVGDTDLDRETDLLMTKLISIEKAERDVSQSDVHAAIHPRQVGISMVVNAASWAEAEDRAREVMRNAIEAIGGRISDETGASPLPSVDLIVRTQSTELVPA